MDSRGQNHLSAGDRSGRAKRDLFGDVLEAVDDDLRKLGQAITDWLFPDNNRQLQEQDAREHEMKMKQLC